MPFLGNAAKHWRQAPSKPSANEPLPEVAAAGHDRCIIPIKQENADKWLNPTQNDQLEMEQSVRAYRWRPLHGLPIPSEQVTEHSANTHVIAANPSVAREIARLRVGQVVHLQGLLVDARRDDGLYIRTSLTRRDHGEGACEVLYVESADVE